MLRSCAAGFIHAACNNDNDSTMSVRGDACLGGTEEEKKGWEGARWQVGHGALTVLVPAGVAVGGDG